MSLVIWSLPKIESEWGCFSPKLNKNGLSKGGEIYKQMDWVQLQFLQFDPNGTPEQSYKKNKIKSTSTGFGINY